MDLELDGEENLSEDLTAFSEEPERIAKCRGPRMVLSNAQLHNRRDQFVQLFEGRWCDIGWELERCKKPEDLISIFAPLSETYAREAISVFCRPSTHKPSAGRLRKLRSESSSLVQPRYRADELHRAALERLHQADGALTAAKKREIRKVRRVRRKWRKEYAEAAETYRDLCKKDDKLQRELRDMEATVARHELFRFLKNERYRLNPVNLANAAAGLPYVGWRRSIDRCKTTPSPSADGVYYQIFKAIRYLLKTVDRKNQRAMVRQFEEGILKLPSRFGNAKEKMAEDWMWLERAIRQVFKAKLHPKALPFEIMKRYLKYQSEPRTQLDMVLSQQAILRPRRTR